MVLEYFFSSHFIVKSIYFDTIKSIPLEPGDKSCRKMINGEKILSKESQTKMLKKKI